MTKYIVVTGGVISGVGKGVSTASIGKILQNYGFTVTAVKADPYINLDAGTLRPTEHGEVWVTEDGGEIDQDLGNYERFFGQEIPKKNNITTGQVYKAVIDKERNGEYLGKTVEVITHIPQEIKKRVVDAGAGYDFCLVEIGGTIGDYQNIPYLMAMKTLEREVGKKNLIHIMVTYLPVPAHANEMKTKPTQQAVRMLSEAAGIFPDIVLCRAPVAIDDIRRQKIEMMCNIDKEYIIAEPDIDTIYRIPLDLENEQLGLKIFDLLETRPKKIPEWYAWTNLVNALVNPAKSIRIAVVGKYVETGDFTLTDSYVSVCEALRHAGANVSTKVEIAWIDAKQISEEVLQSCSGILIPGGFGESGVDGKIKAIHYARTHNIPFLGLCYGMQLALVEFARNMCNLADAHTTEVNPATPHPIVTTMPEQENILAEKKYGASMRLGGYAAILKEGSKVYSLYKTSGRIEEDRVKLEAAEPARKGIVADQKVIFERHRHRYEVNPIYVQKLEEKGMVFSGYHQRMSGIKLMEFIELPTHRFFIATQAHPEFRSTLEKPSPLFRGFIEACLHNSK